MPTRMTSASVTFRRPFLLSDSDESLAAGTYTVETEEEQITAISFPAWKRIATVMHVKRGGAVEYLRIDPAELQEAQQRDAAPEVLGADGLPERQVRLVRRKKY